MNPQLARERGKIEQRLADQGIRYGSQAYASAMDDYNRQATDARFAAIGQAGQEQQRMMDMAAQRAGFQNAAQAQANSQNAALAGFGNAGLAQQLAQAQSGFNAQNAARNQYMQEQYAQRNQPLNEITALDGRLAGAAAELAQLADIADRDHRLCRDHECERPAAAAELPDRRNRAGIRRWAASSGSAASLAARRSCRTAASKQNIDRDRHRVRLQRGSRAQEAADLRVGVQARSRQATHVGPMAQDVEKIDRGAVTEIDGIKHIKPERVMGNILRAA